MPVKTSFPKAPAILTETPPMLKEVSTTSKGSDGTSSNVKMSEFLNIVTDNYATYYEVRQKLIAWQEWYKTNKQIFEVSK